MMLYKVVLSFMVAAFFLGAPGQSGTTDSLALRVTELRAVLDRADTIMSDEAWSDSVTINYWIAQRLLSVLAIPMADSTLERVTTHPFLQNARSKDGRLWTFNWYENSGGSFHSFCHVFFYRTPDGRGIAIGDDENFCNSRAPFYKIHELRSRTQPGLYLGMATVKGCTSCCGNVAVVFQLIGDSLNLDYPAFVDDDINYQSSELADETPSTPCYLLGARCGNLPLWEFDAEHQRINYAYRIDDLSPKPATGGEDEEIVRGTLQFDGEHFTEKMGEAEPPDTYPRP